MIHGRSLSERRPRCSRILKRVKRPLRFFRDWLSGCVSFGGLGHLLTFACYVFQSVCLDIFLIEYLSEACLVVLVAEIPLGLHLLWYWRQDSAAKAAPFQWFVYSWIHGAKIVVLFCKVMPELPTPTTEVVDGVGSFSLSGASLDDFFSSTTLANILLLTPVFYTLLMFRTGKAIFGSTSSHRISVDLIMHYDMLWHVVIDMVDMVDMFHYARLAEFVDKDILNSFPLQLVTIQSVVPFLLFLSTVLHGQSLPGVVVDEWHLLDSSALALGNLKEELQRTGETDSTSLEHKDSASSLSQLVKDLKHFRKRPRSSSGSDDLSARGSGIESDNPGTRTQDSKPGQLGCRQPPLAPLVPSLRPSSTLVGRGSMLSQDSSLRPVASPAQLMLPDQAIGVNDSQDKEPIIPRARQAQAPDLRPRSDSASSSGSASRGFKAGGRPQAHTGSGSNARAQERHLLTEKKRIKRAQVIIDLIQRHTVVVARKRSAIVSIFFVDLPFLCVRASLWLLSVRAKAPHFPGLGAKNGVCFLLNTLQFTLVQMATSEGYAEIQRLLAEYRWQGRSHKLKEGTSPTNASGVDGGEPPRTAGGAENIASLRPPVGTASATVSAPTRIVAKANIGRSPAILHSTPLSSEATPHSGSASTPNSAQLEKGSPHIRALQLEKEQHGIAEVEYEIRRETRRTTSICAHFWALAIAFGGGILLAQASQNSAIQSVVQWLDFTHDD